MKKYPYSIPSREEILETVREAVKGSNARVIARELHVKRTEMDGLLKRLDAMERDGQLLCDAKGNYKVDKSTHFITGYVHSHPDGYGFVIPEEGGDDIFLSENEMHKVMHNDKVQVRVVNVDKRGRPEGIIVSVLTRAHSHIVGRLINENGVWLIAPEDKRIVHDILVDGSPGKAKAGQIVNAELVTQPSRYSQPIARIVEVVGNIDDPGIEIEIAVRKFGLPHVFSKACMDAAARLSDTVLPEDYAGRVDLRDVPLVTIDGEDARDFDDAVYCEPVKMGDETAYRLIVAIADVSHYVKPNEPIDSDALLRATSVYFPRRVIPMLPEKLSNGLCSLNPDVDRLVLVCDALVYPNGQVEAYQFYPAVMHSAARLTYTEVAAIIKSQKGPEAVVYSSLVPHLLDLYGLYNVLAKAREERGAIDFETVETYIVSNAAGKIEKILPRVRNDAHKLIEECMLVANVCAADFITTHHHPGTYRVHAQPNEQKLEQVRSFLAQLGLSLAGGDSPKPSDYAVLIKQIEARPDAPLLQTMLLRSMQQAMYSPDNIGHFGLSYGAYTHFTSPIRRYPDLLTHRVIKALLLGKRYVPTGIDKRLLNTNVPSSIRKQLLAKEKSKNKQSAEQAIWEALGLHCSANERRADDASRDVEAWLKCYFIRDKLGEHFTGTISGVTGFGIFVQLDDLFIEGLVHIGELGHDYYHFDEVRHELKGENSGVRYQLTDRVIVQVSRVDMDARQIDLRLIDGPFKVSDKKNGEEVKTEPAQHVIFDRYKKRNIATLTDKDEKVEGRPVSRRRKSR